MAGEILLKAGTNEMEMLVFRLGDGHYGVNVAKMQELMSVPDTIIKIPNTPVAVEGTFVVRELILPLVNLSTYLELEPSSEQGLVVIVEMNKTHCGIRVDSVDRIYRMRWDEIGRPPEYLTRLGAPLTGVTTIEGHIVMVLDMEAILAELLGKPQDEVLTTTPTDTNARREKLRLMIVDDSPTIRDSLDIMLRNAGFSNITRCIDGLDAWTTLEKRLEHEEELFDIILSDIEMPEMDGLHLTARVKGHNRLKQIPVILFSSIVSDTNDNKGKQVGADAQVTKFDIDELVSTLERFI